MKIDIYAQLEEGSRLSKETHYGWTILNKEKQGNGSSAFSEGYFKLPVYSVFLNPGYLKTGGMPQIKDLSLFLRVQNEGGGTGEVLDEYQVPQLHRKMIVMSQYRDLIALFEGQELSRERLFQTIQTLTP